MSEANCGNCRFWSGVSDETTQASCRRYPPQLIEMRTIEEDDMYLRTYFPVVEWDDWCGEHQSARNA